MKAKTAKIALLVIAFISVISACKKDKKIEDSNKIEFSEIVVSDSSANYTQDTTIHNVVRISYLKADGTTPLADSINNGFFKWLSAYWQNNNNSSSNLNENTLKANISVQIQQFIQDLQNDETLKDCETCKLAELKISAEKPFQNSKIVSIVYNDYSYSGGAHGMYGLSAFNFDKETGKMLDILNISSNLEELTKRGYIDFEKQNGNISDFNFESSIFSLPNSFYFTDSTMVFYYHIGDIAPYSSGEYKIEMKNDEIKDIVKYVE